MKNDCYGCKERKPSCHSICPKYAEFRKALDAKNEARHKAITAPINEYKIYLYK